MKCDIDQGKVLHLKVVSTAQRDYRHVITCNHSGGKSLMERLNRCIFEAEHGGQESS